MSVYPYASRIFNFLKIIFSFNDIGLVVSTDQSDPCQSAHHVHLSLTKPAKIKTLTLSFPYPILVNDISATLHRTDHFIDLVLKKGLYEPWPVDFQLSEGCKWKVDSLKPWENKTSSFTALFDSSSLAIHLKSQFNWYFNLNEAENVAPSIIGPSNWNLRTDQLNVKEALQTIRNRIESLLVDPTTQDLEYFGIQLTGLSSSDWCLLVLIHRPLLTSPLGSPILLLTVIDKQMAINLKIQGKLSEKTYTKEYSKTVKNIAGKMGRVISVEASELQQWRFILRLNSTKIVPGSQQTKHLRSGIKNPWIFATFLSPLYADTPGISKPYSSVMYSTPKSTIADRNCCVTCKKILQTPKRCSRCHSIVYCSVECQRSDWPQHKLLCKVLKAVSS